VPVLNKKVEKCKTTPKGLAKRLRWVQDFFYEIQRHQTFRVTKATEAFLSITDRRLFEAKKKELKKVPIVENIRSIQLLEGKSDNELTEHRAKVAEDIGDYARQAKILYSKLIASTSNTSKVMLFLSDSLVNNASILKDLAIIHANIEV